MAALEKRSDRTLMAVAAPEAAVRAPPANLEAEQALLGAILVNNDAFDRVSDFLKPEHFAEELHRRIYETAGQLIRLGKVASAVTLRTFLGDHDLGGMTIPQYLARLAAEATTIINAVDYAHAIHDLAIRRELINIGGDVVNAAYDAGVDHSPRAQIEEAERKLYAVAETGRYEGGFHRFSDALTSAVDMAAKAWEREGGLSGIATGMQDLDRMMGGLQPSDLIIVAGRPGMGKTALATNIAFNVARAYRGEPGPDGRHDHRQWRHRRLFLAGNVVGTTRHPHHRRTGPGARLQDPPRRHHRRRIPPHFAGGAGNAGDSLLHRPYRRHFHRPARRPRPPPQAPARPRPAGGRLSATALRLAGRAATIACRS